MSQYVYQYFRPSVTADVAVFSIDPTDKRAKLLLIQRKHDPHALSWALPGGFIEENEPLIKSAQRELEEETGIKVRDLGFFNVYGDPQRDPRGRTITMVYWAISETNVSIQAMDDALNVQWFDLDHLPNLAFDHLQIIKEIIAYLKVSKTPVIPHFPKDISPSTWKRFQKALLTKT